MQMKRNVIKHEAKHRALITEYRGSYASRSRAFARNEVFRVFLFVSLRSAAAAAVRVCGRRVERDRRARRENENETRMLRERDSGESDRKKTDCHQMSAIVLQSIRHCSAGGTIPSAVCGAQEPMHRVLPRIKHDL